MRWVSPTGIEITRRSSRVLAVLNGLPAWEPLDGGRGVGAGEDDAAPWSAIVCLVPQPDRT